MRSWSLVSLISLFLLTSVTVVHSEPAEVGRSVDARQVRTTVDVANGSPEVRYLEVVSALKANGYKIESITITFLNRAKILASNPHHLREIVISRASGQILRDAIVQDYSAISLSLDGQLYPIAPEMIIENSPDGIMIMSQ